MAEEACRSADVFFLVSHSSACPANVLRIVDQVLDLFYARHVSDDHLAQMLLMSFVLFQRLDLLHCLSQPWKKVCRL